MKYEEFKQAVADAARDCGVTEYELYYTAERSSSVSIFQHEVKSFESSEEGGVSFRCLVGGHMGYASTQQLSKEEATRIVRSAMDNAASLETEEREFLAEGGGSYRTPQAKEIPALTPDQLRSKALEGQEAMYAADALVTDGCETEAAAVSSTVAIYNSRGLDLRQDHRNNVLFLAAVVSDGQEINNSYEVKTGDLTAIDLQETAGKAVADAKSKLGADVAPTGAYPVVFAPRAMASLLATFSSVFSSEAARKGLSRLLEKEGQRIASEAVTLVDDPFYPDSPAPMPFDAEGSPTCTKNVIDKGVLQTLLYNLKSAAALGKETTGNASKAGYAAPVDIRPFTFYLAPGSLTEEELLQKAGSGVYIDFLGGLHAGANPISGDFSLQSAGFLIEDGKKTKAVKSFTVAGNFYDLLQGITAVSDRVEYRGMGGVTSFASPHVLAEGLSIAGK